MTTVKVNEAVRVRRIDTDGKSDGDQKVLRSLVGLKVSAAIRYLESHGALLYYQPMAVNGVPTHRRSAQVLKAGDILTLDP